VHVAYGVEVDQKADDRDHGDEVQGIHEEFEHAHERAHLPVMVMSLLMAAAGIGLAWYVFAGPLAGKDLIGERGARRRVHTLLKELYYIDALYMKVFVGGIMTLRLAFNWFDERVVDGLVNLAGRACVGLATLAGLADHHGVDGAVRGLSKVVMGLGQEGRQAQSGRLQEYIAASVLSLGVILFVALYVL